MNNQQAPQSPPLDYRRMLVLVLGVILLVISVLTTFWPTAGGSGRFAASAFGRIGLVMIALWLAWPSLRKPAAWLPPGVAVMGVVALAVLAAQPRLIVVAIPALGTLLAIATIVRAIKR